MHIAAQRDAAGCHALAHAGRLQGLGHGAGGQQHAARTHLQQLVAATQARADHPAVGLDHRLEARLQEIGAGLQRATRQDLVEPPTRQHGKASGDVDAPAARSDAGNVLGALRRGHHGVQQAQPGQGVVRVGNQPVTADLVAADGLCIHQQHAPPGLRQRARRRAAGRSGTDHQHLAIHP